VENRISAAGRTDGVTAWNSLEPQWFRRAFFLFGRFFAAFSGNGLPAVGPMAGDAGKLREILKKPLIFCGICAIIIRQMGL
jgi:hypothetical protein